MANRHAYITNPFVNVTGAVGTHQGTGVTCIPIDAVHCLDEDENGKAIYYTDAIDIMGYTEYSFLFFNTADDDITNLTLQPQLSMDEVNFYDTTIRHVDALEAGDCTECVIAPTDFGHYARIKIIVEGTPTPLYNGTANQMGTVYVLFHGRYLEEKN